jgi:hypothetical protein
VLKCEGISCLVDGGVAWNCHTAYEYTNPLTEENALCELQRTTAPTQFD